MILKAIEFGKAYIEINDIINNDCNTMIEFIGDYYIGEGLEKKWLEDKIRLLRSIDSLIKFRIKNMNFLYKSCKFRCISFSDDEVNDKVIDVQGKWEYLDQFKNLGNNHEIYFISDDNNKRSIDVELGLFNMIKSIHTKNMIRDEYKSSYDNFRWYYYPNSFTDKIEFHYCGNEIDK